jgi:hypothetical protein
VVLIEFIGIANHDRVRYIHRSILFALSEKERSETVFTSNYSTVIQETSAPGMYDERPIFRVYTDNQWQRNKVIDAINTAVPANPLIINLHVQFHNASVGALPANTLKESDG